MYVQILLLLVRVAQWQRRTTALLPKALEMLVTNHWVAKFDFMMQTLSLECVAFKLVKDFMIALLTSKYQ